MTTFIVLSVLSVLSVMILALHLIKMNNGLHLIPHLNLHSDKMEDGSLISVIISAKDEEKQIQKTILSLLAQSYKNLEIILVNDRSVDLTKEIMEKCRLLIPKEKNVTYKTVHIEELPNGWAGKNHGLYQGYLVSKGDFLLFTDADIVFKEDALSKTMAFVNKTQADHVAMLPYIVCKDGILRAFTHLFLLYFAMFLEPWKVYYKGEKGKGIGVGAFNLIKRETYEKLGTHQAFALHPVDDVQLGKRVKALGCRCNQHFVVGKDLIEVEWYESLWEAIKGFEKNSFGALNYSVPKLAGFIFLQYLLFVQPFVGIVVFQGWEKYISLFSFFLLGVLYLKYIRTLSKGILIFEVIILPLTVMCYIYTLIRSAVIISKKKGIHWRGTFYELEKLKKYN